MSRFKSYFFFYKFISLHILLVLCLNLLSKYTIYYCLLIFYFIISQILYTTFIYLFSSSLKFSNTSYFSNLLISSNLINNFSIFPSIYLFNLSSSNNSFLLTTIKYFWISLLNSIISSFIPIFYSRFFINTSLIYLSYSFNLSFYLYCIYLFYFFYILIYRNYSIISLFLILNLYDLSYNDIVFNLN